MDTRPHLVILAGKVTDSVTCGFLPAAARLGLRVTVLTDRPADHRGRYGPDVTVTGCRVTDYREVVDALCRSDEPVHAVFSNSDFLQAPAALTAAYLGLPGKDWRAATRAKNKALMRRHLAEIDPVFSVQVTDEGVPEGPYPLVLKPREGVASEDVFLVGDPEELKARYAEIRKRRDDPLVAEEYLPGRLYTLETLGDGERLQVLGSFRTTVSPPRFAEERLEWAPVPPESEQILAQLKALGVGFGACHTEFVVHEGRAHIIEVNYRIIGDHADFLLADLLQIPVFERVLRVHLGEPLGEPPARPAGHAVIDSVFADRPGVLRSAPDLTRWRDGEVDLVYRPVRRVGDPITLTGTNRDYLGTVQAIGPDAAAVEAALARFKAGPHWEIS